MEKCLDCGGRVNTSKGNCIKVEGGYIHKKCPKDALKDSEKQQWASLRNTINEQYITRPSEYYQHHSLNWKVVSHQIKQLHDEGYSYEEIEYATKQVFEEFGMFYGFGGVVNRIVGIIAKRNKKLEMIKDIESKATKDKPIDLSGIINESEEW